MIHKDQRPRCEGFHEPKVPLPVTGVGGDDELGAKHVPQIVGAHHLTHEKRNDEGVGVRMGVLSSWIGGG